MHEPTPRVSRARHIEPPPDDHSCWSGDLRIDWGEDGNTDRIEWCAAAPPKEGAMYCLTRDTELKEALEPRLLVEGIGELEASIAELKRNEQALPEGEERFSYLVQNTPDIISVFEADGTVRYESPAIERALGYRPEERVGTNAFGWAHPDDKERALATFTEISNIPGVHPPMELRVSHADGSWRYLEHVANNLLDDPSVGGIVVSTRDVTERRKLEEQLRHRAFHDPLTDLPNRALFADRLEQALARASRGGHHIAVLYMDLDDFKLVNDGLGHGMGDRLLIAVAGRLKACLRPEDTIARLGGDEFAVLLGNITSKSEASHIAARIAEALKPPFALRGREVFATTSIGIALSASDKDGPEDLLHEADSAMYQAKNKGKARYAQSA